MSEGISIQFTRFSAFAATLGDAASLGVDALVALGHSPEQRLEAHGEEVRGLVVDHFPRRALGTARAHAQPGPPRSVRQR